MSLVQRPHHSSRELTAAATPIRSHGDLIRAPRALTMAMQSAEELSKQDAWRSEMSPMYKWLVKSASCLTAKAPADVNAHLELERKAPGLLEAEFNLRRVLPTLLAKYVQQFRQRRALKKEMLRSEFSREHDPRYAAHFN